MIPCLYIIGRAISILVLLNGSSYPARWGLHSRVQVSRTMKFGVGSILTRDESGNIQTKTWLFVRSGTESRT